MEEYIKIGIIQTSLNREIAFKDGPKIEELEGDRIWNEIKKGYRFFSNEVNKPNIVVLPELSVPRKYIRKLEKISIALNCITIAGVGYNINEDQKTIKNQAIMVVPNNWDDDKQSNRAKSFYIGKSYFAPKEKSLLEKAGYRPVGNPNLYLVETGKLGTIGVAICYDFLDVQRLLLYQAEVHHYFILAYNRDINTFLNIAETVARTMFCNVIVSNTGHYGGSLAISPYFDPHKRTIYKSEGNRLFNCQIVEIPLYSLDQHHLGKPSDKHGTPIFKSLPPGFSSRIEMKNKRKRTN